MIRWTGLEPWQFEFTFPGSLTSTFLVEGSSFKDLGVIPQSELPKPESQPPQPETRNPEGVKLSGPRVQTLFPDPESLNPNPKSLSPNPEIVFFIDNLPVRIHVIIVMIRWTGLAPWEFECFFQVALHLPS